MRFIAKTRGLFEMQNVTPKWPIEYVPGGHIGGVKQ